MKLLLTICGFILVAIGVIGIFVPLLPTTPFLLLALVCFSNGSDRFYNWLYYHRTLGITLRDWKENKSIPFKAKLMASLVFTLSGLYMFPREKIPMVGKITFAIIAVVCLTFIWTRPNSKKK